MENTSANSYRYLNMLSSRMVGSKILAHCNIQHEFKLKINAQVLEGPKFIRKALNNVVDIDVLLVYLMNNGMEMKCLQALV